MANKVVQRWVPLAAGAVAAALGWWLLSPLAAVIGFFVFFVGVKVALTPRSNPAGELLADGISKLDLETTLREARSKLTKIQNEAFKVTKAEARKKIDAIGDVISRILDDVKKDPKDLKAARTFFSYYLDATVKIVTYYVELSLKPAPDDQTRESVARVEGELDTIRIAYEKQLKLLSENDMMDLDTELTVLKRTIELEGLGESPAEAAARKNPGESV